MMVEIFSFEPEVLRQILEDAGYDVVVDDVCSGRRETVDLVCTIDIDQAGRVKFVRTELEQEPTSQAISADGRTYHLLEEHTKTITITTQLQTPRELREVLPVLEQMSKK